MKKQLFKKTKSYPYSSMYPDESKDKAMADFRKELVMLKEWPYCYEHHPSGLPLIGKLDVETFKPYSAKYVITLECPECQSANKSSYNFKW
jgi:hypothetical protein